MISASEFMLLVERKAIEGHACYIISLVINICKNNDPCFCNKKEKAN